MPTAFALSRATHQTSFRRISRTGTVRGLKKSENLARVAAFTGEVFVMSLFLWGCQGWLYQKTILVYLLALAEEMLLIYLLPEWRSDVGGIHRLLLNQTGTDKPGWQ